MSGHRECKPQVHSGRVSFDRRVNETLDTGERNDLLETSRDVTAAHAKNGAVEIDVLATGQLGMEAGSHLEQGCDTAASAGEAGGRFGDPGQDLQQGALARPIPADDPERLPLGHLKAHIAERPDLLSGSLALTAPQSADGPGHRFPHGAAGLALPEPVALAQVFDLDRVAGHQITSAKRRSVRWK